MKLQGCQEEVLPSKMPSLLLEKSRTLPSVTASVINKTDPEKINTLKISHLEAGMHDLEYLK